MLRWMRKKMPVLMLLGLLGSSALLSGCAAALVAGGLVGGYALAKDMEDGQLIDKKEKKNKGWFD